MRLLHALAAVLLACACAARAGVVTKIRDNGPDANRLIFVIVAEGYTAAQQAQFDTDAAATITDFFRTPPWSSYPGHVNVYTDFVASNERGADKPAPCYPTPVARDTAFDASFCWFGTQRLLACNEGNVRSEVLGAVPNADIIAVLVNDTEYGGSGGSILTVSTHPTARGEIFLHESGHTFADLADEYTTPYPGFPPGDGEANVDFDSALGSMDWDLWIDPATPMPTPNGTAGVAGAFEGARYLSTGIYRPQDNCKMRALNVPFCRICSESHVQMIYMYVSPLDGAAPPPGTVTYDPCDAAGGVALSVVPLLPGTPSWMTYAWEIDGVAQPETGTSLVRDGNLFGGGTRSVSCVLKDATPLVRHEYLDPMSATAAWTLQPAAGADRDGDGVGDACDCAPDDPAASAPPSAEAGLLRVARPATLTWPPSAPDHDVARGLLSVLHATGAYSGTCLPGGAAGTLSDAAAPGARDGFWYLVRGRNACGNGPWGARSDGAGRTVSACP